MKIALAFFVVVLARTANADSAAAEAKFKTALEHFKAQDYATACVEFDDSEKLDPNPATEYYLAKCAVQHEHLAEAWNLFTRAAAGMSEPKQQVAATQAAAGLTSKVGLMSLAATHPASGLVVELDKEVVTSQVLIGAPVAVEPGAHSLRAIAPGHDPWTREFSIAAGETLNLSVPELPSMTTRTEPSHVVEPPPPPPVATPVATPAGPPERADAPVDAAPQSHRARRAVEFAGLGIGVAGLVVGGVFGILANSTWSDAHTGCTEQGGAFTNCPAGADQRRSDAETQATVATIGVSVGVAALATATIVWLTSSDDAPTQHSVRIVPSTAGRDVGFAITGRF